jgi:hypothetical protein
VDDAGGDPLNIAGWIPTQFAWGDAGAEVRWAMLGKKRLLDPFFEQTMQREMMHPFHHLFRLESSVDQMLEWMDNSPTVPLAGIIFHMSRCGSTLIAQMLAASEDHIVASEPAPLDGVLRAHLHNTALPRATQLRWLRGMVAALGQTRGGGEQRFFLKLDCWHVHQADLLREAFPDVPFIFLYREPLEVMVSHAKIPAAWTVPGMLNPLALMLRREDWEPQQMEVYCARALEKICEGGLVAAKRHGAMLVNYEELPLAMFGRLFHHMGLGVEQIPTMLENSQRNAKSPQEPFASDTKTKQAAATERVRAATERYLRPVFQRLELERQEQVKVEAAARQS